MEDKFDKYIKQELDSIYNAPIPSEMWDKENIWQKIKTGMHKNGKTISINWLYAAASIIFILFTASAIYYKNYSRQLSTVNSENKHLLNLLIAKNIALQQIANKPLKTDTVIQTKEIVKQQIVNNTIYIHDTMKIISYIKEPANEQLTINKTNTKSDSATILSSVTIVKQNKLHYVISNEINKVNNENKITWVSLKSLVPEGQEAKKLDLSFNLSRN